jgi:hypothetical protein
MLTIFPGSVAENKVLSATPFSRRFLARLNFTLPVKN